MTGTRKKKYTSGEGAKYWTRNKVLRKLQLSLKTFRRLCILKGIYPREPHNRKKAQHGDTSIKTLYAKKDIQFLMHEPIIWKLRELKTHCRKVARAKSMREFKEFNRLRKSFPEITLDHIVKERYPTFLSALRDLDDCLTMCFLFSTFPQVKPLPRDLPAVCRRLTFEFLHAVIASQALRKVFISIKGYYFQVEIKGQTITWIMPHNFGFEPQPKLEVDFNIMVTFVQFYTVLLGFVNFRLYHCLNLYYPPKISSSDKRDNEIIDKQSYNNERIAALNIPLQRSAGILQNDDDDDLQIDVFENATDDEAIKKAKKEAESVTKLKTLFKGLKVFINREVPRLPLVFTLKCFGAEVSWDKTLFVGATFDESDETITHQIVDRPSIDKQYISRYYIQPQWVFDSVNARRLLPVEKYFIGVELPPHLSPFVDADEYGIENYVPPEQLQLNMEANGEDNTASGEIGLATPKRRRKKKNKKDSSANSDSDEDCKETQVDSISGGKVKDANKISNTEEDEKTALDKKREKMKKKMAVKTGIVIAPDPMELKKAEYQEFKLREKMVPKKYKKLYASMMRGKHNRKVDKIMLSRKRVKLERMNKRQNSDGAVSV